MHETFEKVYTRDNCFILQESWYTAFLTGVDGTPNPHTPPIIYYINQGVVEIWENKQGVQWFKDVLLRRNVSDSHFFPNTVKRYQGILRQLSTFWKRRHLNSISELKKFIRLMTEGTIYFLVYYYSCMDQRNPKSVQYKAIKIRAADTYYDNCDRIVRNTIHHLYPKISYDEALSITRRELERLPNVRTLKLRNRHCVFIPGSYRKSETLGNFRRKHKLYTFIFNKVTPDPSYIRGVAAFHGKARGRVRVIKIKSALRSFKTGEILVAPMTTPTYVPVMSKAAAIITDEGGITCHAAVVAREIRIPCIIGTKIATRVLQDGDMVEVDASRGLVKKL